MVTPETLLEQALYLHDFGGMASIHLQYIPYKGHWECQASWSSGKTVTCADDYCDEAMEKLSQELERLRIGKDAKGGTP